MGGAVTTFMRLNPKPAAAVAASAFLLLLLLDLTWPGHGVWLLVVGIPLALMSAALWWHDRLAAQARGDSERRAPPEASVGMYGLSGAMFDRSRPVPGGVALSLVCAPIAALAILLFIGGAIGSAEPANGGTATALQQDVTAIDRSRDGEPAIRTSTPLQSTQDPVPTATTVSPPANTQSTGTTKADQPSRAIRPIVVAAPKPASAIEAAVEQETVALPRSANTFEYVVEEGDTLYEIAERYGSTVEALMEVNQLDSFSFIHPGDVLLVPNEPEDDKAP